MSNTLINTPWKNSTISSGEIGDVVTKLKELDGQDILVYGGASFATSLIEKNLVDEFYFLVDPFRLGDGLRIFKTNSDVQTFTLIKSIAFLVER